MPENLPTTESLRMVESRERRDSRRSRSAHCQARRQPGNPGKPEVRPALAVAVRDLPQRRIILSPRRARCAKPLVGLFSNRSNGYERLAAVFFWKISRMRADTGQLASHRRSLLALQLLVPEFRKMVNAYLTDLPEAGVGVMNKLLKRS